MTDQTPATESGRRLAMVLGPDDETMRDILAIEAEARADALREAADAVRAEPEAEYRATDNVGNVTFEWRGITKAAVLAILDPQP